MDRRIEDMTRTGTELAADYVGDVLNAANKLMDTLMRNVEKLTRGVIGRRSVRRILDVARCSLAATSDRRRSSTP